MATPEQNAKFNEQLRDVLVNNGIALANTTTEGRDRHTVIGEETYNKLLETITLLALLSFSTCSRSLRLPPKKPPRSACSIRI